MSNSDSAINLPITGILGEPLDFCEQCGAVIVARLGLVHVKVCPGACA